MKLKRNLLIITLIVTIAVAFTGCNSNPEASKKYADSWYDQAGQKTIIKIAENEDGKGFTAQIAQAQSNTSEILWTMDCEYNKETEELEYKNAEKTSHSIDSNGKENKDTEYTDGTGSFKLDNHRLFWTDKKDDAGSGCIFFRFSDVVKELPKQ